MNVRIGPVGVEHAGELWTVQRAAFLEEVKIYESTDIPPLRETLEQLRVDLSSPHVLALAAWLGTRLVGSVRGRIDGDRMEIARLGVAPDLHGRGVGRQLLTSLEDSAPPQVRTLWLYTGGLSEGNQRMYRRAGYREYERLLDSAGIEVLRMEKPAPGYELTA